MRLGLNNLGLTGMSNTFSPSSLFINNEQGIWLDSSDFSTMFQDSAGTTPVTAVGQPVGKILDKSGRGNHATQATAVNRPILQQDAGGRYYLACNGTNSSLATGSIDFTGTSQITTTVGLYKPNDVGSPTVVELSTAADTNAGAFYLRAPSGGAANYQFLVRSNGGTNASSTPVQAAPDLAVLTLQADLSAPQSTVRRNGSQVSQSSSPAGGGPFGNYPIYIGARGGTSLYFGGRIYGLIVRGAASSATQIAQTETWMNRRTGAY